MPTKDRYKQLQREYADNYDLSTLNSANDKANLETLIRNTILIEQMNDKIDILMNANDVDVTAVSKLSTIKSDLVEQNGKIERQLNIDRKSRKKDNETSPAQYIMQLKQHAKDYLEQRLVKVSCPTCKILVMRFSPAYHHTEYHVAAQCPQCNKAVVAHRKERDVFFDLAPRDKDWRRKYMLDVKLPRKEKGETGIQGFDDEFVIDDDAEGD